MKLVTYQTDHGPRVAALHDDHYVDLNQADPAVPSCIKALLAGGPALLAQAEAAAAKGSPLDKTNADAANVELPPVIPSPQKIICIGLNYADHARESGLEPPTEPCVFSKFPSAVLAAGQPVVLPKASEAVDYEAELVVVIGRGGRHIAESRAREHIAGYCCGLDVSARDWQMNKPGGQWQLGKSFDTFAPIGPALVTADEIPEPGRLKIQLRLNGQTMQDSSTEQLIFSVETLVAYVSEICTLAPGDLIFTGTPPGVGFARKPPVLLKDGDVVEVEIESLGVLRNPMVAEGRE